MVLLKYLERETPNFHRCCTCSYTGTAGACSKASITRAFRSGMGFSYWRSNFESWQVIPQLQNTGFHKIMMPHTPGQGIAGTSQLTPGNTMKTGPSPPRANHLVNFHSWLHHETLLCLHTFDHRLVYSGKGAQHHCAQRMPVYNLVGLDPSNRALLDCKSPLTNVNLNVQARRKPSS